MKESTLEQSKVASNPDSHTVQEIQVVPSRVAVHLSNWSCEPVLGVALIQSFGVLNKLFNIPRSHPVPKSDSTKRKKKAMIIHGRSVKKYTIM